MSRTRTNIALVYLTGLERAVALPYPESSFSSEGNAMSKHQRQLPFLSNQMGTSEM